MYRISAINRRSGRIGLLLLAVLLLLIPNLLLASNVDTSAAPVIGPAPGQLRVMTYNIRHAEGLDGKVRPQAIVKQLQSGGADVIALQEVDRYKWRSGLQDQVRYFARELGMHYVFAPAIRSGFSQYGIALLSRYPLESPQRTILRGGREPRALLTAKIQAGGRTMTVATTHLGVAASERSRQLPQLLDILQKPSQPFVLMGDFNSTAPDLQSLGLTRLRLPAATPTVLKGGEIDHIFVSPELSAAVPAAVIPSRASDHVPVTALLALKPNDKP